MTALQVISVMNSRWPRRMRRLGTLTMHRPSSQRRPWGTVRSWDRMGGGKRVHGSGNVAPVSHPNTTHAPSPEPTTLDPLDTYVARVRVAHENVDVLQVADRGWVPRRQQIRQKARQRLDGTRVRADRDDGLLRARHWGACKEFAYPVHQVLRCLVARVRGVHASRRRVGQHLDKARLVVCAAVRRVQVPVQVLQARGGDWSSLPRPTPQPPTLILNL